MRKIVESNGRCPFCGSPAYLGMVSVGCTSFNCEHYNDTVIGPDEISNDESDDFLEEDDYFEEEHTEDV